MGVCVRTTQGPIEKGFLYLEVLVRGSKTSIPLVLAECRSPE